MDKKEKIDWIEMLAVELSTNIVVNVCIELKKRNIVPNEFFSEVN